MFEDIVMADLTHQVSGDPEAGFIVQIHDGDRETVHVSIAEDEQTAVAEAIAKHQAEPSSGDPLARLERKVEELAASIAHFAQRHAGTHAAVEELKAGFESLKAHASTITGLGGAMDALGGRIGVVEDALKPKNG
jgi:hypothetical protein